MKEKCLSEDMHKNVTHNFDISDTNGIFLYSNGYFQQELKVLKNNGFLKEN